MQNRQINSVFKKLVRLYHSTEKQLDSYYEENMKERMDHTEDPEITLRRSRQFVRF